MDVRVFFVFFTPIVNSSAEAVHDGCVMVGYTACISCDRGSTGELGVVGWTGAGGRELFFFFSPPQPLAAVTQ